MFPLSDYQPINIVMVTVCMEMHAFATNLCCIPVSLFEWDGVHKVLVAYEIEQIFNYTCSLAPHISTLHHILTKTPQSINDNWSRHQFDRDPINHSLLFPHWAKRCMSRDVGPICKRAIRDLAPCPCGECGSSISNGILVDRDRLTDVNLPHRIRSLSIPSSSETLSSRRQS